MRFARFVHEALQFSELARREIAPFSAGKVEVHVHDAHALQPHHIVTEVLAHPANLPIQALGEHDAELFGTGLLHFTSPGHGPEDGTRQRVVKRD